MTAISVRFVLSVLLIAVASVSHAQQPELVVQAGHTSPVNVISFSPDGKLLASGSGAPWSFVEVNVVKLWDVASGTELRTFVHKVPVDWVGFSHDGRSVIAKGSNGNNTCVWDIKSGAELSGEAAQIEHQNYPTSPEGKIVAEIDEKNIHLKESASGNRLRTFASRTSDFQKVMFSPDSTILATGGCRYSVRMWDLRSGVLRTLQGHTDFPVAADFSPDSRLFATGGRDLTVRLWDVASGREIKKFVGHTDEYVKGIHFSPNGKTLLTYDKAGFKLWDIVRGRELVSAPGFFDDDINYVIFSPDGETLVQMGKDEIRFWSTETGKAIRTCKGGGGPLQFTPDGKILLAGNSLWNVESEKQIGTFCPSARDAWEEELRFGRPVMSPDGSKVAIRETKRNDDTGSWKIHVREVETSKILYTIEAPKDGSDDSAHPNFSADSKYLFNVASKETTIWDAATGKPLRTLSQQDYHAHFREIWAMAPHYYLAGKYSSISPNGVYSTHFGPNGDIHLCTAANGAEIVTLLGIDETDWLVVTAEGFFDGSPVAWKQLLWRFNNDTFNFAPLEAFFNEFYHPGLLKDVLTGNRPVPPKETNLSQIDRRLPMVSISRLDSVKLAGGNQKKPAAERTVTLLVDVCENASTPSQASHQATSGAQDVRLFRNGGLVKVWRGDVFEIDGDESCKQIVSSNEDGPRRVQCRINVPLMAGENEFTAYAFNCNNVKSIDAHLSIVGDNALQRTPSLHVLTIGINQYAHAPLNLRYAVADAEGFAGEVVQQQKVLQNFNEINLHSLADAQATKENVLSAMVSLAKKAQPEDSVMVYFAGHGVARKNRFYLIPHDAVPPTVEAKAARLDDLVEQAISDRDLERAFERVDAAQVVFVVDACNSGQVLEADEKRRGPMNSKGLAQLAYEKGMYVLTASQSFQAAQEVSKLGHGLLTYVLVEEGLKRSVADTEPRDNTIDLREWLDYATRRVPQMQIHEMHQARQRGGDLSFAEEEASMAIAARSGQRPRVFYPSATNHKPLVVATAQGSSNSSALPNDVPPLKIAFEDRTVMDQPLPPNLKAEWQEKIAPLFEGQGSRFQLIDDPAAADWRIQVAAVERPDLLYLMPPQDSLADGNDDAWRLSPPGDAAIDWLKTELEQLSQEHQWQSLALPLGETRDRAFLGVFRKGPAEDLKAEIVEEQNGIYHTPNRTQAVLGAYGKMLAGNRLTGRLPKFEQRGLVQQLERLRQFTTVAKQGRGSGKDFLSFAGSRQAWQVVDLGGQVSAGRQSEVQFEIVGVRLDQNDVIRALNGDAEALAYFGYLQSKKEAACLVLENVVLSKYASSQGTNLSLAASAKTSLTNDNATASFANQRNSSTQFAAPIVRCYQMYEVKLHQNRVVELVAIEP